MRSRDGGGTWETALALAPRSADGDFARFHFVFVHGGRLYVQAQDRRGGMFPRSMVFDGSGWTDGPNLQPIPNTGAKPLAFAGEIVYFGARGVMAFDGRAVRLARAPQTRIHDLVAADRVLYVLDGREVLGTQDLASWIPVASHVRAISLLPVGPPHSPVRRSGGDGSGGSRRGHRRWPANGCVLDRPPSTAKACPLT